MSSEPAEDGDDDWLESDEESPSNKGDFNMASKDTSKVQGKMYDEGYREGIGIGKEANIQVGFDQGYNEKGAALGLKYGHLLGTVTAMEQYLIKKGTAGPNLKEGTTLKETVKALQVEQLVEPDWEALEHERQHGANIPQTTKETEEEKRKRESLLDELQARADKLVQKAIDTV